jgi:hypothetical protein
MNFTFWEQIAINIFLSILMQLKVDPARKPLFKSILVHVVNDACEILGVTPPTIP